MTWNRMRALAGSALVLGAVLLGGCTDVGPVAPEVKAPAAPIGRSLVFEPAEAPLLPMLEWSRPRSEAVTVRRTLDWLGGTISVDGITLVVPPLALRQRTTISMTVPAGKYVQVELEPHGLQFRVQPLLVFPLLGTDASLLESVSSLVGVYSSRPPEGGLIRAEEVHEAGLVGRSLGFRIQHFSRYAPARGGWVLTGG